MSGHRGLWPTCGALQTGLCLLGKTGVSSVPRLPSLPPALQEGQGSAFHERHAGRCKQGFAS
eukprot:7677791-Pyramimonas_sp.AAC.1